MFFQNANNSVRVPDAFMHAVLNNGVWQSRYVTTGAVCQTYRARDLLHMIAEATHVCGDPGMQFDTAINDWHTCPNSGRINASNPCSEFMFLDDTACNLSSINLLQFLMTDGASLTLRRIGMPSTFSSWRRKSSSTTPAIRRRRSSATVMLFVPWDWGMPTLVHSSWRVACRTTPMPGVPMPQR